MIGGGALVSAGIGIGIKKAMTMLIVAGLGIGLFAAYTQSQRQLGATKQALEFQRAATKQALRNAQKERAVNEATLEISERYSEGLVEGRAIIQAKPDPEPTGETFKVRSLDDYLEADE